MKKLNVLLAAANGAPAPVVVVVGALIIAHAQLVPKLNVLPKPANGARALLAVVLGVSLARAQLVRPMIRRVVQPKAELGAKILMG